MKRTLIFFTIMLPIFATDSNPKPTKVETHTQRIEFPDGGTLRLIDPFGEVTLEGWDQPGVELTTTKAIYGNGNPLLEAMQITAKTDGKTVVVNTARLHRTVLHPLRSIDDVDVDYSLKVPRKARIEIDHAETEVNITGITGDIQATSRYGPIVVRLPGNGHYAINAHATLGNVSSDFPGNGKRQHLFGESFLGAEASSPQKLDLKTGMGDVMILKINAR